MADTFPVRRVPSEVTQRVKVVVETADGNLITRSINGVATGSQRLVRARAFAADGQPLGWYVLDVRVGVEGDTQPFAPSPADTSWYDIPYIPAPGETVDPDPVDPTDPAPVASARFSGIVRIILADGSRVLYRMMGGQTAATFDSVAFDPAAFNA